MNAYSFPEMRTGMEKSSEKRKRDLNTNNTGKWLCSICNKKKVASMVICKTCEQWFHCSCLGMTYQHAMTLSGGFLCKEYKGKN